MEDKNPGVPGRTRRGAATMKKLRDKIGRKKASSSSETPIASGSESFFSSELTYEVTETFPYGIEVWVPCDDAAVDICFIHGLTGARESTWTAKGQKEPWPKQFLDEQLGEAKARILAWGYDAYPVKWGVASTKRLSEHSHRFLADLAATRTQDNEMKRPLIIVAHSIGGLISKETILLSKDSPSEHLKSISNMTKGIIFMGTPHHGSPIAKWGKLPADVFGMVKSTNADLLRVLKIGDEMLDSVNQRFGFMLRNMREGRLDPREHSKSIECTCFFEAYPFPGIGEIVPRAFATFEFDPSFGIDANHSDMVKFASPRDPGFILVLQELRRWVGEMATSKAVSVELGEDILGRILLDLLEIPVSLSAIHAVLESMKLLSLSFDLKIMEVNQHRTDAESQRERRESERNIIESYLKATQDFFASLSFVEMMIREASIETATSQWIYSNAAYVDWTSGDRHRLLWIKGKPGSGKSVLMKALYDERRRKAHSSTIVLGFFFNARGSDRERSREALYKTMLHDLAHSRPDLKAVFLANYLRKRRGRQQLRWEFQWQLPELVDMFHLSIEDDQLEKVEILIDALDECSDDDVNDVVSSFSESLEATAERRNLKVCWSSRFYPHIDLRTSWGVEVRLNELNARDIERYLRKTISDELQKAWVKVIPDIVSAADGIFLWARLVCSRIVKDFSRGVEPAKLQRLLSKTPRNDLDKLFLMIFNDPDFSIDQKNDFQPIADIILGSYRALSLEELYTALLLESAHDEPFLELREEDEEQFRKRLISASGGLIEVVDLREKKKKARKSGRRRANLDLTERVGEVDYELSEWRRLQALELDRYCELVGDIGSSAYVRPDDTITDRPAASGFKIPKAPIFSSGSSRTTRVQVIHESVREFFLVKDGMSIIRAQSSREFEKRSHTTLTRACFNGLAKISTTLSGVRSDQVNVGLSVWDKENQLLVPPIAWNPTNSFLCTYVAEYAISHFEQVIQSLDDVESIWETINAAEQPRSIIHGYLIWCCYVTKHSGNLPVGYKKQLQTILRRASYFDANIESFDTAVSFPDRFEGIVRTQIERKKQEASRLNLGSEWQRQTDSLIGPQRVTSHSKKKSPLAIEL